MSYPEGKKEITGYVPEAWHYRFVGTRVAQEIYKKDLTIEEYLTSFEKNSRSKKKKKDLMFSM